MKRPLSETQNGRFPLAQEMPRHGQFLLYGNLCIDCTLQVPSFPKEDSSQRAQSFVKKTGGNGANSCTILAQLVAASKLPELKVSLLSIIPERQNADEPKLQLAIFAMSSLERHRVDTSLLQAVAPAPSAPDLGVPTSFVLLSGDTGARTIVSSRSGLKEMDAAHFQEVLSKTKDLCWCHLEFRQPGIPQMLEMLAQRKAQLGAALPPVVSLEVEKSSLEVKQVLPLLQRGQDVVPSLTTGALTMHLCDVAFFSSDFVRAAGAGNGADGVHGEAAADAAWRSHEALRCLEAMAREAAANRALLICPWGSLGAFALDTATGTAFFQAAKKVEAVDSLGAGDTFIAASICALAFGSGPQEALRCGCLVAGRKVAHRGLEGVATWQLPEDLPWRR